MSRTNVVIDDELVARVKELYGLRTTREAIDFALRYVAGTTDRLAMLDMKGSGWEGDLAEMRRAEWDDLALVAGSGGHDSSRAPRRATRGAGRRKRPGTQSSRP